MSRRMNAELLGNQTDEALQLQNPEWLEVNIDGDVHHGFNQLWYPKAVQRISGCGPTVAAVLLYYLNKRNRNVLSLTGEGKQGALRLMEEVWRYVTPGFMGLNSTAKFKRGMDAFLQSYQMDWDCKIMDVQPRHSFDEVGRFLVEALGEDCPVAFLNLQRGSVTAFEGWHWIVVTGFDGGKLVTALDEGGRKRFNLEEWVNTTKLGGGLAYIRDVYRKGFWGNHIP